MKMPLRSIEDKVPEKRKLRRLSSFLSKTRQLKRNIVVEDLSKKLIPIIGSSKFAAVLHNVVSPEECSELIKAAEEDGFSNALVQGLEGEYLEEGIRKCGRRITDNEQLAGDWYRRTIEALEGSGLEEKFTNASWVKKDDSNQVDGPLRAVGLNEKLRFLKYEKGDRFRPHLDNMFVRGPEYGDRAGETSYVTFILFLNDGMKGGILRFGLGNRTLDVIPKAGSVAIFDHDIYHEGCEVSSGRKYAVRSDVMYSQKLPKIFQEISI